MLQYAAINLMEKQPEEQFFTHHQIVLLMMFEHPNK